MDFLRRLPPVFYLGLFPVVLLVWLWADSIQYDTTWDYCPEPYHRYRVMASESCLFLGHASFDRPGYPGFPVNRPWGSLARSSVRNYVTAVPPGLFPPARRTIGSGVILFDQAFFTQLENGRYLPFWLILACYLPLWLAPAWWQARRRRRKREVAGGRAK
jgi:hypothetical protein